MASITLPIRALVVSNPNLTIDEILAKLAEQNLTPKKDTVSTIRSDTLATIRLIADAQAVNGAAAQVAPAADLPKVEAPKKKATKNRPPSRSKRWEEAASDARAAFDQLQSALETLKDIQSEFEEWKDNLPENLQSSALGEKLETICGLEIEGKADDLESLIDEIEGADLPLGFGRD